MPCSLTQRMRLSQASRSGPCCAPRVSTCSLECAPSIRDWQTAVNGTHGDILEKNPGAVKGFIKGMIRAYQFMKDTHNNAELLQIAKDAKITVEEQEWSEALAIQRDFWPADGALNLKGTELVLQRERDDGRISKDFTMEKFIRLKPLEEAQRELSLRP